jgi:hypothetical protein
LPPQKLPVYGPADPIDRTIDDRQRIGSGVLHRDVPGRQQAEHNSAMDGRRRVCTPSISQKDRHLVDLVGHPPECKSRPAARSGA